MFYIHGRFDRGLTAGLQHSLLHLASFPSGHCDVDLPTSDVVLPTVQSRDLVRPVMACLLAVWERSLAWGHERRWTIVDDSTASRGLRFHQAEGGLGAEKSAGKVGPRSHAAILNRADPPRELGAALVPALLKSKSIRPKVFLVFSNRSRTAEGLLTSLDRQGIRKRRGPASAQDLFQGRRLGVRQTRT